MAFNGPVVSLSRWEVIFRLQLWGKEMVRGFCIEEESRQGLPQQEIGWHGNKVWWQNETLKHPIKA